MRPRTTAVVLAIGAIAVLLSTQDVSWDQRTYETPAAAVAADEETKQIWRVPSGPEQAVADVAGGRWMLAHGAIPVPGAGPHCLIATLVTRRRAGLRYGLKRGWQHVGEVMACPDDPDAEAWAFQSPVNADKPTTVVYGASAISGSVLAAVTWEDGTGVEATMKDSTFIVAREGHVRVRTVEVLSSNGNVLRACQADETAGDIRCP